MSRIYSIHFLYILFTLVVLSIYFSYLHLLYTTFQKFGVGKMFLKEFVFSYSQLGCIYFMKNAVVL